MTEQEIASAAERADVRRLNVHLAKVDLPDGMRGACCLSNRGGYYIIINTNLTAEEQEKAFIHEALHIWHDDFNSGKTVQEIETERHGGIYGKL